MVKSFRIAWLRRESILFLDEKTGNRFEYPIPGQAIPNVPSYLRLANGTGKSGFVLTGSQLLEGLHLRKELTKSPWCIALPCDLQNAEEAMLIDFGIHALGAKRVLLAPFPSTVGPADPQACRNYISVTDTFRSVSVTYFDAQGNPHHAFLPHEDFTQTALNDAIDQLCPTSRPPVYVDDLDGSGRWNHLGTPVNLEDALSRLRATLQRVK